MMRPAILALLFCSGCGGGGLCTAKELNAELTKHAGTGGTVTIGACTVTGTLDVPFGVTLKGQSEDQSIIAGDGAHAGVFLHADRMTTALSNVKILSNGPVGVLARGSGRAELDSVRVEAMYGVAIGVEGVETLTMNTVSASGPVTAANAINVPNDVKPSDYATHGLVLVNVSSADLNDVNASGFASVGALFVSSDVSWKSGSASDNLSLGVEVEGGNVTLDGVSVCRTLQGVLLLPAFGLVFTSSASVTTTNLKACENQGYGVLQDGGSATHMGIDLEDNMNAALWAQRTDSVELTGMLSGNHFASVVLVDAKNAAIHDATISNTILATRVFHGTTMEYQVGDGVQLVRASDTTVLRDVMIENNDRTGVLVELGGSSAKAMTFDNVTVRVTDNSAQHGAIAQDGPTPDGWDVGIKREGTTESLDQSFAGHLQFVSIVGPCNMPRPSDLKAMGLSSLTGI
jgi:hypothetical protein